MAKDIDDLPESSGFDDSKWEDELSWLEFKDTDWVETRIVTLELIGKHWVEYRTNKKKGVYPIDCPRFDSGTGKTDKVEKDKKGKPILDKKGRPKLVTCHCCDAGIKVSVQCLMAVIVSDLVGKDDNPIRCVRVPQKIVEDIRAMKKLNKKKDKKSGESVAYSVTDKKYGCLVHFKYNEKTKDNSQRWAVNKGERSPLSDKELAYDVPNFTKVIRFPDQDKVYQDLIRHEYLNKDGSINNSRVSNDDWEPGEEDSSSEKKKSSKGKKLDGPKGKAQVSSEDEKSSEDSESESESEPKSKSKAKVDSSSEDSEKSSESEKESEDSEKSSEDESKSSEEDSESEKESEDSEKSSEEDSEKSSSEDDSEADSEEPAIRKVGKKKSSSEEDDSEKKSSKKKSKSSEDDSEEIPKRKSKKESSSEDD